MGIVRSAVVLAVALACATTLSPSGNAEAADPPAAQTNADCPGIMLAIAVDASNVVVRVVDPASPFTGTITAYGGDRMWTGEIGRAALVNLPYGGTEASVIVHTDGPIDGIAYKPAGAACSFHAGIFSRDYIEGPNITRPTLDLGTSRPAPAVSCAHSYVSPSVTHAVEPEITDPGVSGTVRVAIALDARGQVRGARVLSSPSATLNGSAVSAASRSEFTPAIFRCVAVPSAYPFGIGYNI